MSHIGEALERDWAAIRHHVPHPHYHDHNDPPPEARMSLLQTIHDELASAVAWGEEELRSKLPTVARLADDAEAAATSPLALAVAAAVHLPPAVEQSFADAIAKVDAELHAAAERFAQQAPAPVDTAAEPVPAQ